MDTNILVIGRDRAILEVIERLINSHEGWHATITETEDAAEKAIEEKPFAIAFVSAGFSAREEEALRQRLTRINPELVVTRHYGGGSGLLENEILGILEKGKQ
jgi:DNA-binding NtrC family response regulator